MRIGVPKEIKTDEYRVALTPWGAAELIRLGHSVCVEAGAGEGSGFADGEYRRVGARIATGAAEVWGEADLVLKVKEPIVSEYPLLREGLILFTYLHLAAARRPTSIRRSRWRGSSTTASPTCRGCTPAPRRSR